MALGIDVGQSRELQAAILGLRRAEKDVQKNVRKYTQALLLPEWKKGLAERAETRVEHRVLVDTARVRMSNQNVRLSSATVGRKLSGGLLPKTGFGPFEFGGDRAEKTTYEATSKKGRRFKVTRRTRTQLRPHRRVGYVVLPTARDLIPRFAALWVQTTVRTFRDAIEGK
jgi:hypothetical protein